MTLFMHGKVVETSAQYPPSRRSDGGFLGNGLQQLFDRAYIPGDAGKLQLSNSVGRSMLVRTGVGSNYLDIKIILP
jgi:hypothetical protein